MRLQKRTNTFAQELYGLTSAGLRSFSAEIRIEQPCTTLQHSCKADFFGVHGTRNLHISAMLHKAFVAVGEKGTLTNPAHIHTDKADVIIECVAFAEALNILDEVSKQGW